MDSTKWEDLCYDNMSYVYIEILRDHANHSLNLLNQFLTKNCQN